MITEDGKVEFNEQEQAVIDKAMSDRLNREGIHEMKEIVGLLETFNYTGTVAEKKAALKADADDFVKQLTETEKKETLDALKEQAEKTGTTPELLATIKALADDMSAIKNKEKAAENAINQQIAAQKMFDEQIKYFGESDETKDIDIVKLNEDPKFVKFLSKQKPTGKPDFLVEVYKDFMELVGDAEANAAAKIQANLDRSTSNGRRTGNDGAGALTPDEKVFVDDHNRRYPHMKMTYQEFSERKRR